jgi:hypothetical protein
LVNVDQLIIVLEEVTPYYVFIDQGIRWDALTDYVSGYNEYIVWLALTISDNLIALADALDLPIETFVTDKQSNDLFLINTAITEALDTLLITGYPASVNDYWLDYMALIQFCLLHFDLLTSVEASSVIDHTLTYRFAFIKPFSYVDELPLSSEIQVLYNLSSLDDFGDAYSITSNFNVSKTIRNNKGFCEYLFEPPPPANSVTVENIPESEWGVYDKTIEQWQYGDTTPSGFLPNTYKVYIGFGYLANSSAIVHISLNSFLSDSFPRVTGYQTSDWVTTLSTLTDFFIVNPDTSKVTLNISSGDRTQGVFLSQDSTSSQVILEQADNTINLQATNTTASILINGDRVLTESDLTNILSRLSALEN